MYLQTYLKLNNNNIEAKQTYLLLTGDGLQIFIFKETINVMCSVEHER